VSLLPSRQTGLLSTAANGLAPTIDNAGLQVAVDAMLTLRLSTWIKPVSADLVAPIDIELDKLSRLSHKAKFDLPLRDRLPR
jgi:hypothetical protein